MFSKVISGAVYGVSGSLIDVEADVSDGFPMYAVVGYLASDVKESRERVTTALRNLGILLPAKRVVINLSPADLRKQGTGFDLAIALSILCSLEYLPLQRLKNTMVIGELGLDGKVGSVNGVLPLVLTAREQGIKICIVPRANAGEAAAIAGVQVIAVATLREAVDHLKGHTTISPEAVDFEALLQQQDLPDIDFSELYGQESLKRAIEVAVAGMHHVLMIGSAGSGKSMAARRIGTIMPPMTFEECLEVSRIYSVAGRMQGEPLMMKRPFREPHHTVTAATLVGGGTHPLPGEISLAHRGVLFLDEAAEFKANVLEVLRQPLEEGHIMLNRVYGSFRFPARFMLVMAMNPCKCGHYPDMDKCRCSPSEVRRYLGRLSRPLMDRLDVCIQVSPVAEAALLKKKPGRTSAQMRQAILRAREVARQRFGTEVARYNASMTASEVEYYCRLGQDEENFLRNVLEKLQVSARGFNKILKVARTIADLDGADRIQVLHLSEAVAYRMVDQQYWGGANEWGGTYGKNL